MDYLKTYLTKKRVCKSCGKALGMFEKNECERCKRLKRTEITYCEYPKCKEQAYGKSKYCVDHRVVIMEANRKKSDKKNYLKNGK